MRIGVDALEGTHADGVAQRVEHGQQRHEARAQRDGGSRRAARAAHGGDAVGEARVEEGAREARPLLGGRGVALPLLLRTGERRARARLQRRGRAVRVQELLEGEHLGRVWGWDWDWGRGWECVLVWE